MLNILSDQDWQEIKAAQIANDPPGMIADRLTDLGLSISQVCLLYAGHAPLFADGIHQSVLSEFIRLHHPQGEQWSYLINQVEDKFPGTTIFPTSLIFAEYCNPGATLSFVHCPYCKLYGQQTLVSVALSHHARSRIHYDKRHILVGTCHLCHLSCYAYNDYGPEQRQRKRTVLGLCESVSLPPMVSCPCSYAVIPGTRTVWKHPYCECYGKDSGVVSVTMFPLGSLIPAEKCLQKSLLERPLET